MDRDNNLESQVSELKIRYARLLNDIISDGYCSGRNTLPIEFDCYVHVDGNEIIVKLESNIVIIVLTFNQEGYTIRIPSHVTSKLHDIFGNIGYATYFSISNFEEEVKIVSKFISTHYIN